MQESACCIDSINYKNNQVCIMDFLSRPHWVASVLMLIGIVLASACLIVAGPLPFDIAITRALQAVFGETPRWAEVVTTTTKSPWVWLTLLIGGGLAFIRNGWHGPVVMLVAFGVIKLLDLGLRAVFYVPKPLPEWVPVAAISHSSGFPSTFALVYAAVCGAVLLGPRQKGSLSLWVSWVAVMMLVVGLLTRVVLGGHWMSQVLACYAIAFLVVLALYVGLARFVKPSNALSTVFLKGS